MRYLHYYEQESDFQEEYYGNDYLEPWTSFADIGIETEHVDYNMDEEEKLKSTPLTFEITNSGNIKWVKGASTSAKTIKYRKNEGEWTSITSTDAGVSISVSAGDEIQFKGDNNAYGQLNPSSGLSAAYCNSFSGSTAGFKVKGNIMSLIDSESFASLDSFPSGSMVNFGFLISYCSGLTDISEIVLPATSLTHSCYRSLFSDCSGLTTTVGFKLPADIMGPYCYTTMFARCTSLADTPALRATTLAERCYDSMFKGCTGLVNKPSNVGVSGTVMAASACSQMFISCSNLEVAPELPADVLANDCYKLMFSACTSLHTAPAELPARTTVPHCYEEMFVNCTSLVNAPQRIGVSDTVMASSACTRMFSGCTQITEAPELPAMTVGHWSYREMFAGCTHLTAAPELPATSFTGNEPPYEFMFSGCTALVSGPTTLPVLSLPNFAYQGMFVRCSSLVNAPALPATTLSTACYLSMFEYCTSLRTAPELPAQTLVDGCYSYMFRGCSSLNAITCLATDISVGNCTTSWVANVASTGTFTAPSSTNWSSGQSGIPNGWTRVTPPVIEYMG